MEKWKKGSNLNDNAIRKSVQLVSASAVYLSFKSISLHRPSRGTQKEVRWRMSKVETISWHETRVPLNDDELPASREKKLRDFLSKLPAFKQINSAVVLPAPNFSSTLERLSGKEDVKRRKSYLYIVLDRALARRWRKPWKEKNFFKSIIKFTKPDAIQSNRKRNKTLLFLNKILCLRFVYCAGLLRCRVDVTSWTSTNFCNF